LLQAFPMDCLNERVRKQRSQAYTFEENAKN